MEQDVQRWGEELGRGEVQRWMPLYVRGLIAQIDRQLYLPQARTNDRDRCRKAHIPDNVEFATKPELARGSSPTTVRL